jgi:hydrogenase maturation protease
MKTIIVGMGNTLLSDDGVGILIAGRLKEIYKYSSSIDVVETSWGGFRIIDLLKGYDYAIIIDAIQTGKKPIGSIHMLDVSDLIHSTRMVSFHDINFATALDLSKKLDIPMPESISVYAIEVEETELISERISQKVRNSIDICVNTIRREISEKIFRDKHQYA